MNYQPGDVIRVLDEDDNPCYDHHYGAGMIPIEGKVNEVVHEIDRVYIDLGPHGIYPYDLRVGRREHTHLEVVSYWDDHLYPVGSWWLDRKGRALLRVALDWRTTGPWALGGESGIFLEWRAPVRPLTAMVLA